MRSISLLLLSLAAVLSLPGASAAPTDTQIKAEGRSLIVEAASVEAARQAVTSLGGAVTHELSIIDAVAALVPAHQLEALEALPGVRVSANHSLETTAAPPARDERRVLNAHTAPQALVASDKVQPDVLFSSDFESSLIKWSHLTPAASVATLRFPITASSDDAAEKLSNNNLYLTTRGLDLGTSFGGSYLVGLRFQGVGLAPGTEILEARLELTSAAVGSGATQIAIHGHDVANSPTFSQSSASYNVSNRTKTQTSTLWAPSPWLSKNSVMESPNLKTIVQELVDRPDWQTSSAVTLLLTTSGHREIASWDRDVDQAPVLVIKARSWHDVPPAAASTLRALHQSSDDASEDTSDGSVDLAGDVLTLDSGHLVGLRFEDLWAAKNATVQHASIELPAANDTSSSASLRIRAQATDDALSFRMDSNNISGRALTSSFVDWTPGAWSTFGTYTSPNLASLVQELVNRPGWQPGNDVAFVIQTLSGTRHVGSYDFEQGATLNVVLAGGPETPPVGEPAPGVCTNSSPASAVNILSAYVDQVDDLTLAVDGAAPGAQVSVDGVPVGCADDHGYWFGHFAHNFLEDCEIVVADGRSSDTATVQDCVTWQDPHFPSQIQADVLHDQSILGYPVRIAVVDTGISPSGWGENAYWVDTYYDAINDQELSPENAEDLNGHGSHVASLAAGRGVTNDGKYSSIAPAALLVPVRAFQADGSGSYADVIRGVEWVIQNKVAHNIGVLNPLVCCTSAVVLLGRSAQPCGHEGLEGRHRGRGFSWQHRTGSVHHRCARQRALRHHGRRHVGQLHPER